MGKNKVDVIVAELIRDITRGKMPPGSRIIETDLAKKFGISRGPLREALQKLEAKKLIVVKPNAGASVVDPSLNEVIEIYRVREVLEGLAARLAAKNMKAGEIAKLKDILNIDPELQDKSLYLFRSPENMDFHYRIIKGSQNNKLKQYLYEDLYYLIMTCRIKFINLERKTIAQKKHMQILEAIENRDAELAEILMRRHIAASRDYIISQEHAAEKG